MQFLPPQVPASAGMTKDEKSGQSGHPVRFADSLISQLLQWPKPDFAKRTDRGMEACFTPRRSNGLAGRAQRWERAGAHFSGWQVCRKILQTPRIPGLDPGPRFFPNRGGGMKIAGPLIKSGEARKKAAASASFRPKADIHQSTPLRSSSLPRFNTTLLSQTSWCSLSVCVISGRQRPRSFPPRSNFYWEAKHLARTSLPRKVQRSLGVRRRGSIDIQHWQCASATRLKVCYPRGA